MFSLKTLNERAVKYCDDFVFQKAYYEDALMACIEACIDIDRLLKVTDYNVEKDFLRYRMLDKGRLKKYKDIHCWLDEKLRASIPAEGIDLFHEEANTISEMEKIRELQIRILCKLNKKKNFSEMRMRALWKNSYLEASRCAGKSVALSREFYPSIRAKWNLD